MNGPYVEGQNVQRCGHYFPDVLRFMDIKRGRIYIRVLDCVHCGQYETDLVNPNEELMRMLDRGEVVVGVVEDDMPRIRERELSRILQ